MDMHDFEILINSHIWEHILAPIGSYIHFLNQMRELSIYSNEKLSF